MAKLGLSAAMDLGLSLRPGGMAGLAAGANGMKNSANNKDGKTENYNNLDENNFNKPLIALGGKGAQGGRKHHKGKAHKKDYAGGNRLGMKPMEPAREKSRRARLTDDEPALQYDREFMFLFAEKCTVLPTELQGSDLQVVLQPGDQETREAQIAAMHDRVENGGREDYKDQNKPSSQSDWRDKSKSQGAAPKGASETKDSEADQWRKEAPVKSTKPVEREGKKKTGAKIQKASELGRTAWAPQLVKTDTERVLRQVRGILNKLTPENFERLFLQLVESITTAQILGGSISMLFEKAVAEPMFCSLNAELCLRLSRELPEFPPPEGDMKPMTFRRVLLNTCQEEFEGSMNALSQEDGEEQDDIDSKAKRRMLGNVKFIGHLFTRTVINQKIVHVCIQQLLRGTGDKKQGSIHENCVECACELLTLTAKVLEENQQATKLVDSYVARLNELVRSSELSSRVKFIIKDVQDLKRARWVPRKEAVTAKTISEIHAEAQAELGIAVLPTTLAQSFAPLSGMKTKADEVQDLLPALRGGDMGWEVVGRKNRSESNLIEGKYSALVGEAPPVPTASPGSPDEQETVSTVPTSKPPTSKTSTSTPKTPEELEKRTKSLLTEYLSSADVAEALMCVKELNSIDFMPKVVQSIISMLLDNVKPAEKSLLNNLLVSLKMRNAISEEHLIKGLHAHTDLLEDLSIDFPLAPQLIGEAVAECIFGEATGYDLVADLCKTIEDTETKRKFVSVILLKLKSKGEKNLKGKLDEANVSLEEILKSDPEFDLPDTPSVKQFLNSKNLSGIVA